MTSRWVADDGGLAGLGLALLRAGPCIAVATAQAADGSLVGARCAGGPALAADGAPGLVWTLDGDAPGVDVFQHCTHVAINCLAADDASAGEVAERFTGARTDRFAVLAFEFGLGGAPLLERAMATFECENRSQGVADPFGRRQFTGLVRRYRQSGQAPADGRG